jgi:hypothetical protein
MTLTPQAIELVVNGDFEDDLDVDNVPDGWELRNPSGDKRICDKLGKKVAYSGGCAFQFKGSAGEKGQLRQTLALAGVQSGDLLVLSAAIDTAYTLPGKLVFVKLRYAEPNAGVEANGKDQIRLQLSSATQNGYTVFQQSLIVGGTPTKFLIGLRFAAPSGKVRLDAVSLRQTASAGAGASQDD